VGEDDEGERDRQLMLAEELPTDVLMETLARRKLEKLGRRSIVLGCHRTNCSETMELLIQAIGEVDKEVEVYILRMTF
jgi:hypothetical protein